MGVTEVGTIPQLHHEVSVHATAADMDVRLVLDKGRWFISVLDTVNNDTETTELTAAQASATMALLVGEDLGEEVVQELYRVIGDLYDKWHIGCRPIP